MNQLWHADQEQAVLKLRWRKSFRGGRVIAQPAATSEQLQQHRRSTAAGKGPDASAPRAGRMLDVGTAGPCTYDPQMLMKAIAALLQAKGVPLVEVAESAITVPGQ